MSNIDTLIDHEKRLTAFEITAQTAVNDLVERIKRLEAAMAQRRDGEDVDRSKESEELRALRLRNEELEHQIVGLRQMIEDDPRRQAAAGAGG